MSALFGTQVYMRASRRRFLYLYFNRSQLLERGGVWSAARHFLAVRVTAPLPRGFRRTCGSVGCGKQYTTELRQEHVRMLGIGPFRQNTGFVRRPWFSRSTFLSGLAFS